jgi:hypothetical protein
VPKSAAVRRSTRQVSLALLVSLGLALRLWNAATATLHDDEAHYVGDAYWASSPLSVGEGLRFLREHLREHLKLDPETGARVRWGTSGTVLRTGHPCLFAYVTGALFAVAPPASIEDAVHAGRVVNALADATTIALLPALTAALGASPGAGLVAAAAYAVFPPAVTYGSLAYLDVFLAPLFVLLATLLARPTDTARRWLGLGIVTGLLASAKQTGLIALGLVPAAVLVLGPRSLRGLALWAVTSVAVVALFTDPVGYLAPLRHPETPAAAIEVHPIARLVANLAYVTDPAGYYWLSFSRHAEPLAPAVARLHYVLTPAYLVLFAAAAVGALVRRAWRPLLLFVAPVALLLTLMLPTDAAWRFHLLAPLVCALIACELPALPPAARLVAVGAALLAASSVCWPARLRADQTLDLGDLLFWNPAARQTPGFYSPERPPPRVPFAILSDAAVEIGRRVWLAPGRWHIVADGYGPLVVQLDGSAVLADGMRTGEVRLVGYVHRLSVALPARSALRGLTLRPLAPGS